MKYVPLTIIFFLLISAISCSKKNIVIEESTIVEMIKTSIEDYDLKIEESTIEEMIETSIEDYELKYELYTGIYQIDRDFRRYRLTHKNVGMFTRIGDILLLRYNTKNKYMFYDYIQKANYELPFHELNEMVFISPREIRLTGENYHAFFKMNTNITMNIQFTDSDRKNNIIGQNIREMETENEGIYAAGGQSNDYSDIYTVEIFGKKALFDLSNIPGSDYTHFGVEYDPLHDVYTITADRNGRLE